MIAAEIAEVVGTERKAWWPPSIEWDEQVGDFIHNITSIPQFGSVIDDAVVELAFIGASVRELAKRKRTITVNDSTSSGARAYNDEKFYIGVSRDKGFFGTSFLHALVAALNESEGA
jgi:uncharacterized NAD-dependent epimerase/dehydratase family protein